MVIFTRLIKPLILIRFGNFNTNAIGDFCQSAWIYKAKEHLNSNPRKRLDFACYSDENWICNKYLADLLFNGLPIFKSNLFYFFWRANRWLPNFEKYDCLQPKYQNGQILKCPFFSNNNYEILSFKEEFSLAG